MTTAERSDKAPAYSLAAVLAIVVVTVGVQAPAVLLMAFVPMFLIASAFLYAILGSTPRRLLHLSEIPVVVVPA